MGEAPKFEFPSSPPESQSNLVIPQASAQQPTEVLKQESPKYVLNNIPKPFKPEVDDAEEIVNEVTQNKEVAKAMPPEPQTTKVLEEKVVEVKQLQTSKPEPIIEEAVEPVKKTLDKTP